MTMIQVQSLPKLRRLPATMPDDGAISIVIEEGVPIFRAAHSVQNRVEVLLQRQQSETLTAQENEELDRYEEIDDYLSHLNRVVRNLLQTPN